MQLRRSDVLLWVAVAVLAFWLILLTVGTLVGLHGLWEFVDYVNMFHVGMKIEDVEEAWGKPVRVLHEGEENSIPYYAERGGGMPIRHQVYHFVPNPRMLYEVYLFVDQTGTVYHIYWFRN